jgi:hypothetical protein
MTASKSACRGVARYRSHEAQGYRQTAKRRRSLPTRCRPPPSAPVRDDLDGLGMAQPRPDAERHYQRGDDVIRTYRRFEI